MKAQRLQKTLTITQTTTTTNQANLWVLQQKSQNATQLLKATQTKYEAAKSRLTKAQKQVEIAK